MEWVVGGDDPDETLEVKFIGRVRVPEDSNLPGNQSVSFLRNPLWYVKERE